MESILQFIQHIDHRRCLATAHEAEEGAAVLVASDAPVDAISTADAVAVADAEPADAAEIPATAFHYNK